MKKTKLSLIAATVLSGALMVPAGAANAADLGGWDESQGSFTSEPSTVNDSGAAASSLVRGAVNHRGKSEQKAIHGTTNKRAHGWTTWTNVYHYTTARMESYGGKVYNTSGRRWGKSGTEAISPWRAFSPSSDLGSARTYYGR